MYDKFKQPNGSFVAFAEIDKDVLTQPAPESCPWSWHSTGQIDAEEAPVMELKALDGIVFQHSKIDLGDTVIIRLCAKEAETWVDGKRLGEYRNKGMTEQDLADWESIAPSISWMTLEERNERLPKEEV